MIKMFEHRHYENLANLVLNSQATTKEQFVLEMIEMFKTDNPKFSTSKFFKASGLKEKVN
jgi:hypothetical protein